MAGSSTWSYDQLRENAQKDWTLAGDDQILRLMLRIGRKLESRTADVTGQIVQMQENVDKAFVKLQDVHNKLVALQQTHFFDHQIQDDEEYLKPSPAGPVDEKAANNKQSKADADELLKKILKDTVNAVDKCYEKVVLDWSDSILENDDDVITRTMIRPIDVYKDLPRPYLIGSEQWMRSKYVGLKQEELEKPAAITVPVQSPPELPSQKIDVDQNAPLRDAQTISVEHRDLPIEPTREHEPAMHSERFFQPPDLSSDFKDLQTNQNREPEPVPVVPEVKAHPASVFFDETPPAAQISATVRKKPNLFAELEDDEEDDDTFSTLPRGTLPKALSRGFKPQLNLFDDDPPEMEVRISSEASKARNLFDDDDDAEEDLFAPKKIQETPPATSQRKKQIEDVINNNRGESQSNTASLDENKNPVPVGVPVAKKVTQNDMFKQSMEEMLRKGMSGGGKLTQSRLTSIDNEPQLHHSEEEETRESLPTEEPIKTPVAQPITPVQKTAVPKGLFDDLEDDDEDDFFANPTKKIVQRESVAVKKEVIPSVVEEKSPAMRRTVSTKSKGLFDHDEDVDDLFGPTPSHLVGAAAGKEKPTKDETAKDFKSVASKYKSRGLFDDDSELEEDLFAPNEKVPKSKAELKNEDHPKLKSEIKVPERSAMGLFGEEVEVKEEEDDDLFGGKSLTISKSSSKLVKRPSLFDSGDDDEEDNLFGPKNISMNAEKSEQEKNAAEEQIRIAKLKEEEEAEIKRVKYEKEKQRLAEETEKFRREEEEMKNNRIERQDAQRLEDERNWKLAEEEKQDEERQKQLIEQERQRKIIDEEIRQKQIFEEGEMKRKLAEQEEDRKRKLEFEEEDRQRKLFEEQEAKQRKLVEEEEERERKFAIEEQDRSRLEQERLQNEVDEERKRIEDEQKLKLPKKLSLFEDLEDNDEETDLFAKKMETAPRQTYSSGLFDEPPDDDDNFTAVPVAAKVPHFDVGESSSEEDSLFAERKRNPSTQTAVKKSIDLFSDLPPDDDDDEHLFSSTSRQPAESVTQKKDVFYDDMAESFPPVGTENVEKSPLFSSPPEVVSSPDEIFIKEIISNPTEPETVPSVRDLIKSHESPSESAPEVVPAQPPPNKLNTNIVINVNAFLPGARPPSLTKRKSVDSLEEKQVGNEASPGQTRAMKISPVVGTPADHKVGENSAVLSSLNKSRAKVIMKRRPSTRRGRQESLRRSQLFDSEDVPEESQKSSTPQGDQVIKKEPQQQPKEIKSPEPVKDPEPSKKNRKLFDSDEEDDSDDLFKPKQSQPQQSVVVIPKVDLPKKVIPKQRALFSDDDDGDSDGDLFAANTSSKAPIPQSKSVGQQPAQKKEAPRTSTDHNPLADLF